MIFRCFGAGRPERARASASDNQRLVLLAGAASLGAVERPAFSLMHESERIRYAQRHPYNQDSCSIGDAGLLVADGVSKTPQGGDASAALVANINTYLVRRKSYEQPPRTVAHMVYDAAEFADRRLQELGIDGSSTLSALLRTNDPRLLVRFRAGDTPILQGRDNVALWRTADQKITLVQNNIERTLLSNSFRGEGRTSRRKAQQMAGQYQVAPEVFMDSVDIVEGAPGDVFVVHSDGLRGGTESSESLELDPHFIIAEASRYANPEKAAKALISLPERLHSDSLRNYHAALEDGLDSPEIFWPVQDDITAAVGWLALAA
jgi:hypothetical protein